MVKYIFVFCSLFPLIATAQTGGNNSWQFLNVPVNARLAASGGYNVSLRDQDISLAANNPASLNNEMGKYLSINYLPYLSDINGVTMMYGMPRKNNVYGIGLTYFSYGNMIQTEENGDVTGEFKARDYALTGTASHKIGNYVIGATVKLVGSHIGSYNSFGALTDLGGMFVHPKRAWTVGLAVKNLGFAVNKYTAQKVNVPFDVQIGTTYKLEHMPLRFSLTAHHLNQPDIVYLDPGKEPVKDLEGNEIKEEKKLGDQVLRHFNLGGEFLLSKNFNIRVGYNHLRRRELRLKEKSGAAGFSLGGMIRIKGFEFAYTRSFYHAAGGTSHLTLTTNFSTFVKKEKKLI
jgi:hypothetical protein